MMNNKNVVSYNRTNNLNVVAAMFEHPATRPLHIGGVMMATILSGIYEIRNTINGHRYIGSSVHLGIRLQVHRRELRKNSHVNKHLQRAWNTYGEKNFTFNVLLYCSRETLLSNEQALLDELCPEYNIAQNTSAPMLGLKMLQAVREKISKALKGRMRTKEHQEKLNASQRGQKRSDEARRNMSLAHKGISQSTELIKRRVEARKGYTHSDETKQKISNSNKGKVVSKVTRLRMSKGQKRRFTKERGEL